METLETISLRKSVRSYKPEQIPEQVLQNILRAGFQAPVGSCKYDSLHITVLQDVDKIKEIVIPAAEMVSKALSRTLNWNFGMPTLMIVSSKPAAIPGIEYANAACVLENMVLAATDQQVDSLIWGGPCGSLNQNKELKGSLGIPNDFTCVLCASFGYAAEDTEAKKHIISVNRV